MTFPFKCFGSTFCFFWFEPIWEWNFAWIKKKEWACDKINFWFKFHCLIAKSVPLFLCVLSDCNPVNYSPGWGSKKLGQYGLGFYQLYVTFSNDLIYAGFVLQHSLHNPTRKGDTNKTKHPLKAYQVCKILLINLASFS